MKKSVAIIGGGASALLLAAFLDPQKFEITIYEQNKTLGRKFLVAGKGGFNLTHSEAIELLTERYTPTQFLKESLHYFSNVDFRKWLDTIGIPTYIGSSRRIYPKKGIKPIAVLNAILKVLKKQHVQIKYEHTWTGWNSNNELIFNTNTTTRSDYTVFALGGSSWKITGSDGGWQKIIKEQGVDIVSFQASNCAYAVDWNTNFIQKHEGSPLKNIAITCLGNRQKGEVVITRFGLEGNAIYAVSPQLRQALNNNQKAAIFLDLKPNLSATEVQEKIEKSTFRNTTEIIRKELKLSLTQIGLLKTAVSKEVFLDPKLLAQSIKSLPLKITGFAGLDEAISTVGGISLNAIDTNYQLKKIPTHYCIGEMLDWDAPTGGYLLQGCTSMGVHLANQLNKSL
ncbi:MAG: TIGR03862 family flavoprotein [Polaribacter sp.]|nr:TIGR03862 family flavoprotein [Polaribacter sp.]